MMTCPICRHKASKKIARNGDTLYVHRRRLAKSPRTHSWRTDVFAFQAVDFCRARFNGGPDRSHLKWLAKRAALIETHGAV